jgi:hypothetical protein
MCLWTSTVTGIDHWNWDGDAIQDTFVPSARPVIGTRPPQEYPLDVPKHLVTDRNAVRGVSTFFIPVTPLGAGAYGRLDAGG